MTPSAQMSTFSLQAGMSEVLTAPVTTASTGGSATTCVRGIPKSQKAFDLLMCAGEEPALAQAEAEQHTRSAASTISWATWGFHFGFLLTGSHGVHDTQQCIPCSVRRLLKSYHTRVPTGKMAVYCFMLMIKPRRAYTLN